MGNFCNLHAHSEGSLLDGAGTPLQRAEQAKKIGQNEVSLTDHGNLIMAPAHIKACQDVGVKPIVGVEAYFKPNRLLQDKDNRKAYHLILLAKNEAGWKNLIKITSEAHTSGFYHKPCLDWELLEKYGDNLICSSACISGYLPSLLQTDDDKLIHETIERHVQIFGDDYFFEIMPHDVPAQKVVNARLANLSLEYDIPLVATGDSHYPYQDWKPTQDVMLMIATGQTRKQREKKREEGEDVYEIDVPLHMFSEDEMYELFRRNLDYLSLKTVEGAIEQSGKIADLIEDFDIDKKLKIPKAAKSADEARDIVTEWAIEGLKRIGKTDDEVYKERLRHELNTLEDMNVMQYFVLVGKIVRWARSQGIRISSGRGSASGSLVCYLIRITTIDPIAYDLLFERFLNPNRKGMPDIDIDFEDRRREEVIDYAKSEFGENHIANILTLGTFGAKSAIKDVSRVLDVPYQEVNIVTKTIPDAKDVGGAGNIPSLVECRSMYQAIDDFAKKYPEVWEHATRIEGHIKGIGKHAGGIVVTDKPIVEYMPLIKGKTSIVTGWSDTAKFAVISDYGFMKIDFLSLVGLSKQGETVDLIEERYGTHIDLDELPVASDPNAVEPEVMEIFQKGQTLGVFQFGGSKGITNFLKKVKPDRMEDLIAVNALYRPGGLEGGDAFKYGDLKHGKIPIQYWHESVIPYLEKTYGIMAYQEQMQQIVQVLGGFSPGESDDMRKATSKLYRMGKSEAKQFMGQYKEQWMKGCAENGLNEEESESIWDRMLAFGGYSFNRSHSASYSLAAYQDAWLKCHYPLEFYSPLLTREDEREPVIRESRASEVYVMPPNINRS